jgi:hypothetical protein
MSSHKIEACCNIAKFSAIFKQYMDIIVLFYVTFVKKEFL